MADLSFRRSLVYFSVLLLVLQWIIYKDFIFGDNYFLFKDLGDDSYTQAFPELYNKIKGLKNGHIPQWSFHVGLGENKYAFWLEPVALSIAFVFFKNDVVGSLIWIQLVYTFLSGVFLFSFFRKKGCHYLPSSVGGIFYAFSGFMIGCSAWQFLEFSNGVMLFALLLLSLQYFLKNKKRFLLPISIALIGIGCNPVLLYFAFLIVIIYLVLNDHQIGTGRDRWLNLCRLGIAGFLGLGLSCFMLLNNLYQMLQSPRGTGMFSTAGNLRIANAKWLTGEQMATSVLRLFSNNLQGIAENYRGTYNYFEAPFWYCGLPVLLLVPQLFHFLPRRAKIIRTIVLGIFLIVALVPYVRFSVWLFTGDYYRVLTLMFIIFFLYLAVQAFDLILKNKKIYPITLFITLSVLLLLLFTYRTASLATATPGLITIGFFLCVYSVLLFQQDQNQFSIYYPYALGVCVCAEVILFSSPTLTERKVATKLDFGSKKGYFDETNRIVTDIKNSDTTFFRMEKDYFSGVSRVHSYNEALVQNFYGSASYASFHNAHYIRFLQSIDALEMSGEIGTRFVKGIREIPEAMRLCGVKYLISNQDSVLKYDADFVRLKDVKGYQVYQLKNYLPLGFTYRHYIRDREFKKLPIKERRKMLTRAVVVDDLFASTLTKLTPSAGNDTSEVIHSKLEIEPFQPNLIEGKIKISQPEILFFSIPFDDGWKLAVDGAETQKHIVFNGLTGVLLSAGSHVVKLDFEPPYKNPGIIFSLISLGVFLLMNSVLRNYSALKIK